jgi:hypothetical protein
MYRRTFTEFNRQLEAKGLKVLVLGVALLEAALAVFESYYI